MKLIAKIIDNATGAQLEQSDFEGDDAQAQLDAWQAERSKTEDFGADKAKSIVVSDVTAAAAEEKAVLSADDIRKGCLNVINMIAATNTASGATEAQMDALFTNPKTVPIILALLTGSPGSAKRNIAIVGPSLYPQAVVDKMIAALAALE